MSYWNIYNIKSAIAQNHATLLAFMLVGTLFMILWDDWRLSLLGWADLGITNGFLLLTVWPTPWALSRTVAMALEGSILWFGARRWPHGIYQTRPYSPFLRVPLLALYGLATWQLYPYLAPMPIPTSMLQATIILLGAGIVLLTTGGDLLHTTLGLLSLLNAMVFVLSSLPIPTDWVLPLTILDVSVGLIGGMGLASSGISAHAILKSGERR